MKRPSRQATTLAGRKHSAQPHRLDLYAARCRELDPQPSQRFLDKLRISRLRKDAHAAGYVLKTEKSELGEIRFQLADRYSGELVYSTEFISDADEVEAWLRSAGPSPTQSLRAKKPTPKVPGSPMASHLPETNVEYKIALDYGNQRLTMFISRDEFKIASVRRINSLPGDFSIKVLCGRETSTPS